MIPSAGRCGSWVPANRPGYKRLVLLAAHLADEFHDRQLPFMRAVRKIQANDIDARTNQIANNGFRCLRQAPKWPRSLHAVETGGSVRLKSANDIGIAPIRKALVGEKKGFSRTENQYGNFFPYVHAAFCPPACPSWLGGDAVNARLQF